LLLLRHRDRDGTEYANWRIFETKDVAESAARDEEEMSGRSSYKLISLVILKVREVKGG
jgi:hypothetical protein